MGCTTSVLDVHGAGGGFVNITSGGCSSPVLAEPGAG